jgi:hypothetical protein
VSTRRMAATRFSNSISLASNAAKEMRQKLAPANNKVSGQRPRWMHLGCGIQLDGVECVAHWNPRDTSG